MVFREHSLDGFLQVPDQTSACSTSRHSIMDVCSDIYFCASETQSVYSSGSEDFASEDEFSLEDILEEETNGFTLISYFLNSYDTDESVFFPADLEDLKAKELDIIERKEKGYYMCRVAHADLYNEIKLIYKKMSQVRCW